MSELFLYSAAILPFLWGISHLIPTANVVKGFGNISEDNRHIITMEWVIEGVALIYIGLLIATLTYFGPGLQVAFYIYLLTAIALFCLAAVSFFTGFRIHFLPFRMCPFVLSASGLLVIVGIMTM